MTRKRRRQTPSPTEHALTAIFSAVCFDLFLFHLYFHLAPILTSVIGSTAVTTILLAIIINIYHQHRQRHNLALTRSLSQLTPVQFEQAVAALFRSDGYAATVSGGANDRGIDIYLEKEGQKAVVQCKRYKQKISPMQIRDFIGAMNGAGVEVGYFVTTSGFTKAAYEAAKRSSYRVRLVNGRELGQWQNQLQAYVTGTWHHAILPKAGNLLVLLVGTVTIWMVTTGVIYWAGVFWDW